MKKFIKIFLITDIIFTGIYFILFFCLMGLNLTFMPFIKIFAKIFIPLGFILSIIYGLVILIKKKKILLAILSIITLIGVGYISFWYILIWYGFDVNGEVTYYNNEKMIVIDEPGFLWSSGRLKFYKWTNPFIRTTKEYETNDDCVFEDGKYWGKEYLKEHYPEKYKKYYDDEESDNYVE